MPDAFERMAREYRERKERERQAVGESQQEELKEEAPRLEDQRVMLWKLKRLLTPVMREAQTEIVLLELRDEIANSLPKLVLVLRSPPIDPSARRSEMVFAATPPRVIAIKTIIPSPRESTRNASIAADTMDATWARAQVVEFVAEALSVL